MIDLLVVWKLNKDFHIVTQWNSSENKKYKLLVMPNVHNDDSICKIMKFFFFFSFQPIRNWYMPYEYLITSQPAFTLTPSCLAKK